MNFKQVKVVAATATLIGFSLPTFSQNWSQLGNDIDGETMFNRSGWSVSVDSAGNTVAIGATDNGGNGSSSGHVRLFEWNGSMWAQKGADIDGEMADDRFGASVALSADGDVFAAGAFGNDGNGSNAGHVRVFEWNGTSWSQKGMDIDGEASDDGSGRSLAMSADGNTVIIGANGNDDNGTQAGHARVFTWNGSAWVQKGLDLDGEAAGDEFGWSVSMNDDGNVVAVGALYNDGSSFNAGHVRIYEWNGNAWGQKGVDIDGEVMADLSGFSLDLALDGNAVIIGAIGNDDSGSQAGHARVFEWDGAAWSQKGVDIDGEAADDACGVSTTINADGSMVAIGAIYNDGNGSNAGHVRVYEWSGTSWSQVGQDIDGEAPSDESGLSIAINPNGTQLIIGAPENDGNGSASGHVRVYGLGACSSTFATDVQSACDSYTWIDGSTYTSSNNTATYTLMNAAGCDSIVTLDLTIANSSTGVDVQTACNSYTWIDGNTYASSNTTATFTLQNIAGCDSVVTLNLTINSVNTATATMGLTITADAQGATYQWIDCDNNNAPISGETGQSFTATANGNFAVIVTQNGCSDTSSCVAITSVGLDESGLVVGPAIYPNPSAGIVNVNFEEIQVSFTVEVLDMQGKRISLQEYQNTSDVQVELGEAIGLYFITVQSSTSIHSYKLMKD